VVVLGDRQFLPFEELEWLLYSGRSWIAALPGYKIQRITFRTPLPLSEGFRGDGTPHGDSRVQLVGHNGDAGLYGVRPIYPFFADEIVRRGAAGSGLRWHFCRPPVTGLDYEMDYRSVRVETIT
jgi:hypothetical protein